MKVDSEGFDQNFNQLSYTHNNRVENGEGAVLEGTTAVLWDMEQYAGLSGHHQPSGGGKRIHGRLNNEKSLSHHWKIRERMNGKCPAVTDLVSWKMVNMSGEDCHPEGELPENFHEFVTLKLLVLFSEIGRSVWKS